MLVIVCPGQGSQTPGFLAPWMELPGFQDRLTWLSAVADIDLVAHGTTSDAETIKDTAIAQPLIVASGLVSLLALFEHPAEGFRQVGAGAGHSVGEITAAAAAGVMSAEQAMVFVRERGKAMAAASAITPTGMSAVVGGDETEVAEVIARHGLTAANVNSAGQVVAAGTMDQLAALSADPPAKARVIPLQVAGAFHTEHMRPAVDVLGRLRPGHHDARPAQPAALQRRRHRRPRRPRRAAAPGPPGQQPGALGPVHADLRRPRRHRPDRDPARRDAGQPGQARAARRRGAGGQDAGRHRRRPSSMIKTHGEPSPLAANPTWRLVVAPAKGTVQFAGFAAGSDVEAGAEVARVETLRDTYPVMAPHGGEVIEWLVEDGDPVAPGQPLLRLHPVEVPASS